MSASGLNPCEGECEEHVGVWRLRRPVGAFWCLTRMACPTRNHNCLAEHASAPNKYFLFGEGSRIMVRMGESERSYWIPFPVTPTGALAVTPQPLSMHPSIQAINTVVENRLEKNTEDEMETRT